MKEYIKFEAKLFLTNKRNRFLFLGVVVFLLGLLFYVPYQNVTDISEKTKTEAQAVKNAIAYVPLHEVEENTYHDDYSYYDHLLDESRAIATQEVALTMFEDLDQYIDAGLRVTETRIQAHEEGYGTLPEEFIVPYDQSLREQKMYEYLKNNSIQIEPNAKNGASVVVLAITWFSTISFFFLLILSCDVLTKDNEHKTIISSYPIDSNRKIIGKLIIQVFTTLAILLCLFVFAYFISSWIFMPGNLNYPESLYWRSEYIAVPRYIFFSTFFILFFVLVTHTVLFSALLNVAFKNKYLNLFIGGFIYIVGYIFAPAVSILKFTPLNYLNPVAVLNGQAATQFNQPSNDFLTVISVLVLWSAVYGIVLSLVFSQKNRVNIAKKATRGEES